MTGDQWRGQDRKDGREGWPPWGGLSEPRGESILSRVEITDLRWSCEWWGGQCKGIGQ